MELHKVLDGLLKQSFGVGEKITIEDGTTFEIQSCNRVKVTYPGGVISVWNPPDRASIHDLKTTAR